MSPKVLNLLVFDLKKGVAFRGRIPIIALCFSRAQ